MGSLSVIVLSIVFFAALVTNMALKPDYSVKLTSVMMATAVLGGSIFYGIGYTSTTGDWILSLIRTPFSVIGMFLGKNDMSAIAGSPLLESRLMVLVGWILHLSAFYSIASAVMVTIGAESLKRFRLFLALKGDLTIIYGINSESIRVGKECLEQKGTSVVLISENDLADKTNEAIKLGMAVLTGSGAVKLNRATRNTLRLKNRQKISVYALHTSRNKNLSFAIALRDAMQKEDIDPSRTSITLPGTEDISASLLQISEDAYGYGYVQVFSAAELAARAMIRLCPPWEFLTFDESARAEQDFDCIVIGFGDTGQAALRHLIMNGQYAGSTFHATVFSRNMDNEAGFLLTQCPELIRNYDISLRKGDGRSKEFYDFLESRLDTLKYIAVCAGNDAMNAELSDSLMLYLKRAYAEHICVVQVTKGGIRYQQAVGSEIRIKDVFTLDMLSAQKEDRNAILLNAAYDTSNRTNWEKWVACDPFSKMSSRASAEFIPALVKASGYTEEEIMEDGWKPGEEKLRILGETEHLRWCAFHFTMGYRTMSREIFDNRAEHYLECVEKGIPCSNRIAKDAEKRLHACLIPTEELDDLSRREREATGRVVDYKQMDINNILMIPQILKAQRSEGK